MCTSRGQKWHTYRHSACRVLRGFQKRGFDSVRDVDGDEAIRGEQVVLATFVDNTKVPVTLGVLVRKDDIDFVALKRGLVTVVVHADRELARRRARFA